MDKPPVNEGGMPAYICLTKLNMMNQSSMMTYPLVREMKSEGAEELEGPILLSKAHSGESNAFPMRHVIG